MRKLCIATVLTFAAAAPALAQQSRASNAFSFDKVRLPDTRRSRTSTA